MPPSDNEQRDIRLYKYDAGSVLRNHFDERDRKKLTALENEHYAKRLIQGVPTGRFDLAHLQAIHRHLFQDVYSWAGEIRQTDIAKTHAFHPASRIEIGMGDIHRRLTAAFFLRGLDRSDFPGQAAEFIGDVNRLHPFREGNGRTQLQYLKQLAEQARHPVDLTRFNRETWIAASIASHAFEMEPMADAIRAALAPERERSRNQVQDRDWER